VWKQYDPEATSFIPWSDFDSLLLDLINTDAKFFVHSKTEMQDPAYRETWIKNLELPLHKKFNCFNFYDCLTLISRYSCMSQRFIDTHLGTMEEIKSKISSLNKMQGVTVIEELLNQKTL